MFVEILLPHLSICLSCSFLIAITSHWFLCLRVSVSHIQRNVKMHECTVIVKKKNVFCKFKIALLILLAITRESYEILNYLKILAQNTLDSMDAILIEYQHVVSRCHLIYQYLIQQSQDKAKIHWIP